MEDSLTEAGPSITLTREEVDAIVRQAVSDARESLWGAFFVILVLLAIAAFGCSLIVREQFRTQVDRMHAQMAIMQERLDDFEAKGTTTVPVSTLKLEPTLAKSKPPVEATNDPVSDVPMIPLVPQPQVSDTAPETTVNRPSWMESIPEPIDLEPTMAPTFVAPEGVQLDAPPIVRPDSSDDDGQMERPLNRGVTIPSPVERQETTDESAQILRRSSERSFSFSPRRRETPGIVRIGPGPDAEPIASDAGPVLR